MRKRLLPFLAVLFLCGCSKSVEVPKEAGDFKPVESIGDGHKSQVVAVYEAQLETIRLLREIARDLAYLRRISEKEVESR